MLEAELDQLSPALGLENNLVPQRLQHPREHVASRCDVVGNAHTQRNSLGIHGR